MQVEKCGTGTMSTVGTLQVVPYMQMHGQGSY